jgi:hypothetical protein
MLKTDSIHAIPCMVCLHEGRLTRADLSYAGDETDDFLCEEGHNFGMDHPRADEVSQELAWPPSAELKAWIAKVAAAL